MAGQQHGTLLDKLGLANRRPPELFRSDNDVAKAPPSGYTHVLRRTWESFDGLIAVLAVRRRPTVFLQECADNARITARQQQSFWSQGIAPLLVRLSPSDIHVYTGLRTPALDDNDVDDNERLVETFQGAARLLELRDFLRSVEAGTVYGRYASHFDPTQAVDQRLVRNLRDARELMSSGTKRPELASIHRILGRILFTCYLEARKALVGEDFGWLGAGAAPSFRQVLSLSDPGAVREALCKLFGRLRRDFRGDLFVEAELQHDLESLRDSDIGVLGELVSGTELPTGQTVLPFYVYDFSVIPIETISAVYEDFIRAEDPKAQRHTGAYYTPPKLVEFTCDLATEEEPDLSGKQVLDPACGSGVFLVSAFNRMAEAWCRQHPTARNGTRAQALARILREQICGVDSSLIACQATCFSLYMAMLDFLQPPEIRRLPERLPDLLLNGDQGVSENGPRTVICADFLSSPPVLESRRFDLILGNPPWVSREKLRENATLDMSMCQWEGRHPSAEYPVPARQVACAFMWEAAPYLTPSGHACLLLPAGVLIGDQTNAFQARWFKQYRVEKVAHLSDLRFFLFPGSIHPTVALRFAAEPPRDNHRVEYLTPKASHATLNDNVLAVEPDDRKSVALAEVLRSASRDEAATCWLSYNWASPRDREFLSRLLELPPLSNLAGEPNENKRWIKGQGFQPRGAQEKLKEPKKPFWSDDHLFLDAKQSFDLLLAPEQAKTVDPGITELRRAPDERLFKAPLVVFNQGFTKTAF
ncbi:MAG: N-6 DNA methylase, partial [Phycisphaerae bacterium]|nr:N-6 DNA methylase [Phycisphaerae bacterium]